jgi:hypothetical protein
MAGVAAALYSQNAWANTFPLPRICETAPRYAAPVLWAAVLWAAVFMGDGFVGGGL